MTPALSVRSLRFVRFCFQVCFLCLGNFWRCFGGWFLCFFKLWWQCWQNFSWFCFWLSFLRWGKTVAWRLLRGAFWFSFCCLRRRVKLLLGICGVRGGKRMSWRWMFLGWGKYRVFVNGGLRRAGGRRVWTWVFGLFIRTRRSFCDSAFCLKV